MAAKNGNGKAAPAQVQTFLRGQIHEAQKAFTHLEAEAEKVLTRIVARGRESRKELDTLIEKLNGGELSFLDNRRVKQFSRKATQASTQVKKRLDGLQTRVVEAVGVASQTQVREINRELSKLTKKLDQVLTGSGKKAAGGQRPEPRA